MFDLGAFSLEDMYRCSADLRAIGEAAGSAAEADRQIVSYIFERFQKGKTHEPTCPLVRLFRTVRLSSLPPEETRQFVASLGSLAHPETTCLSLTASRGIKPDWNDPSKSRAHRLIPLPSPLSVANMPMVSGLVAQLGLPAGLFSGTPFSFDDPDKLYGVFHVESVPGSSLVPDQATFVEPFGILSALGIGGVLTDSQVFVLVLFSTVAVPRETADLFRLVAPSVALAISALGRDLSSLEGRIRAYERLVRHHEQVALAHQGHLQDLAERLTSSLAERQRFAALVENSSDFIGIADADSRALYLNPAGRRMVELPASVDVTKTHIGDYYPRLAREHMEQVVIPTTLREGRWEGETALRNWRTNAPIAVSDHHFTIRDPESCRVLALGTVTRDISDRRRADDEREKLLVSEREARAEAQTASRAKDDFLAFLGHELRNPLAPIISALELIRLRGHRPREQEILERQSAHLARLVDDLLDVSRLTRGKVLLHKTPTEIATVVRRAVEMASPLFEQREQQLFIDVPPDGPPVSADPGRLAQVISNLLTNASKFSEIGSSVWLSAERGDGVLTLRVRDEGVGIPEGMLDSVFESFFQHDESGRDSKSGLGLGLTIVRTLVHLHGGTVVARSAGSGKGSEFTVELPASSGPRVSPAADRAGGKGVVGAEQRKRVLVVDDNEDAAEILGLVLSELGHEVKVANDGPSALEVAQQWKPEIALLDIGLPVMDGYELGRRLLGSHHRAADLQVIAITGYGQDADRRRSLEAGFAAHLVKPVTIEALTDAFTKN